MIHCAFWICVIRGEVRCRLIDQVQRICSIRGKPTLTRAYGQQLISRQRTIVSPKVAIKGRSSA